jgi:acyl-CoA synthetase (NDP forming)
LAELVRTGDVHLLGPNTNLNAFEEFRDDLPGSGIALITQSGHQGRPIFQGQELGIRVTHWAPTGNEVDLEFADFAAYLADQPEVGVIAAYIEGFKDGRTMMLAADHAAQQRTPIVCVKVGRTDAGAAMAKAHTGHLAGSDAVVSAVFRQLGIIRVDGLDELLDVSAALARTQPPTGDGVAIYSISGGTGAHMADLCAAAGLRLPELRAETQAALHDGLIAPFLTVANPVDSGGGPVATPAGRAILDLIVGDPNVDVLVVPITGALDIFSEPLTRDLIEVHEATGTPVFVVWGAPPGTDDSYYRKLLNAGLPVFRTFGNCVRAVRAYLDYWAFAERHVSPFTNAPTELRREAHTAREVLRTAGPGGALSEHMSKELLSTYGVARPVEVLCSAADDAVRAAHKVGYPVVMKVSSPDLLHKSDAGLVQLGVTADDEVRDVYAELLARARDANPGARIDGVLVSEEVTDGTEMVVGLSQDPLFGPVVMVGSGGVLVEVLGDVTFRVPPFGRDEAARMVRELRGFKLLEGVRGRPPANADALVDVVMAIERLALDLADDIAELDINPIVVRPDGAVALDALVVAK